MLIVILCLSTLIVISSPCISAENIHNSSLGVNNNFENLERASRRLDVFRFRNVVCRSTSSDRDGICYTADECRRRNGTSAGSCASNMGTCCIFTLSCGNTTNLNNFIFSQPNAPTRYLSPARTCTLSIQKTNSTIGQLRIDLIDMTLAPPNAEGACIEDTFTVTGGSNPRVPTLCGNLGTQHLYVEYLAGNTATIEISIVIGATNTIGRSWNIRVNQIGYPEGRGLLARGLFIGRQPVVPARGVLRAPPGCLQYFTGTSGVVTSFNFGNIPTALLNAGGVPGTLELRNLNYGVCVRPEPNACSIEWSMTIAQPQSFAITGDAGVGETTAIRGNGCFTDYVVIPNSRVVGTTAVNAFDRYCGTRFPTVTTSAQPFTMTVVTDASETLAADTVLPFPPAEGRPADIANRGFSLSYRQISC